MTQTMTKTETILDYALMYHRLGFSVIPLKYGDKKPAIKTWKPYQEKRPTEEEIRKWFTGKKRNIAIITGRVSNNLVVIDFDNEELLGKFMENLRKKGSKDLIEVLANTWIVKTGKGYHIYVKLEDHQLVPRTKPRLIEGLDIKAEGGYIVAPPSLHPNGKKYCFVKSKNGKVYGPPVNPEPITLTEKEWKELLGLLEYEERHVKIQDKKTRNLNDKQIHNIIDVLKPYYVKGWRNYIIHYLLGALVKNNISYESSYKLVETLCDITSDEEKQQRLYLVDYHYDKRVKDIGIEKLKGYSGLRDVIVSQLIEKGFEHEDAQDQALEVINKLNEILGVPIERKLILVPIKTGATFQAYCNDPKRGILILRKNKSKGTTREHILGYYIEKVIVLINPADKKDRSYTLILKHPKNGDTLTYQEETIGNIVNNLENIQQGVRTPSKLKGALSSLIEGFVIRGLAEIKNKIPATGFFEVDGKLMWFESHRFKTNLREPDEEKTIEALRKLEELLKFYRYNDKALAGLYFGIQAPLGFIRKKYGRENKILFHHGESHVGKTLLMKMIGYIWGLEENQSIVGAAKITAPQLAEKMNNTTLPITLDEVRTTLTQPDIVDMIKNSTTNIHIKSRIRPRLGYKIEEFYAHASIAMTTNYVPQLLPGLEERLIPVEWTVEDKRNEKEVEEFLEKMAKYKDELSYIGSYLRDMFIRRWEEIKKIIMELDQLSIGKKLLEMMYEELGLNKPEWLRDIIIKYEIETPSEKEIFFDVIREDLIDAVKKANIILIEKDYETYEKAELSKTCWRDRIIQLGRLGFLPSYMFLGKKNVYIKTTIIEHIRRKTGYEITGGLKNLAKKLGYKYDNKPGVGKCMYIPIDDLVRKLRQEIEDED